MRIVVINVTTSLVQFAADSDFEARDLVSRTVDIWGTREVCRGGSAVYRSLVGRGEWGTAAERVAGGVPGTTGQQRYRILLQHDCPPSAARSALARLLRRTIRPILVGPAQRLRSRGRSVRQPLRTAMTICGPRNGAPCRRSGNGRRMRRASTKIPIPFRRIDRIRAQSRAVTCCGATNGMTLMIRMPPCVSASPRLPSCSGAAPRAFSRS